MNMKPFIVKLIYERKDIRLCKWLSRGAALFGHCRPHRDLQPAQRQAAQSIICRTSAKVSAKSCSRRCDDRIASRAPGSRGSARTIHLDFLRQVRREHRCPGRDDIIDIARTADGEGERCGGLAWWVLNQNGPHGIPIVTCGTSTSARVNGVVVISFRGSGRR
jgi:hypothetical protein